MKQMYKYFCAEHHRPLEILCECGRPMDDFEHIDENKCHFFLFQCPNCNTTVNLHGLVINGNAFLDQDGC